MQTNPKNPFAAITDSPLRPRSGAVPLFLPALWAALFLGNGVVAVLVAQNDWVAWQRVVVEGFSGAEPLVYSAAVLLNLYCLPRLWSRSNA